MQNIMYCSAGYSHNLGNKAVVSRWLGELGDQHYLTLTPGRGFGGYLGDCMVFRGNGGVSVVANIVQRKYNIKLSVNMGGWGGGRLKYWSAFWVLHHFRISLRNSNKFRHYCCKLRNRNRKKNVSKFAWKPFKSSFS